MFAKRTVLILGFDKPSREDNFMHASIIVTSTDWFGYGEKTTNVRSVFVDTKGQWYYKYQDTTPKVDSKLNKIINKVWFDYHTQLGYLGESLRFVTI